MITTAHHDLCDECETVAHCCNHGCIPKQPANDTAFVPLQASKTAMHNDCCGYSLRHEKHPLRTSGELPVMFVGPEPDNWSHINRWARNAVLVALTIFALAVTLWVAVRWPL